jgi:hypothetical protein
MRGTMDAGWLKGWRGWMYYIPVLGRYGWYAPKFNEAGSFEGAGIIWFLSHNFKISYLSSVLSHELAQYKHGPDSLFQKTTTAGCEDSGRTVRRAGGCQCFPSRPITHERKPEKYAAHNSAHCLFSKHDRFDFLFLAVIFNSLSTSQKLSSQQNWFICSRAKICTWVAFVIHFEELEA